MVSCVVRHVNNVICNTRVIIDFFFRLGLESKETSKGNRNGLSMAYTDS